jgi:glycosyltransferase involved in cell wall biosynthesis
LQNRPIDSSAVRREGTLCIVTPYPPSLTETFIRAHAERLPIRTIVVQGWRPSIGDRPVLSWPRLAYHKLARTILRTDLERERTSAYLKVFREHDVVAVLAEYGDCGVWCAEACRRAGVPLVVHFHGYDASHRETLATLESSYAEMFAQAAAVIAVSRRMERQLVSLGAPRHKILYNPCGVDTRQFAGADPARADPVFIAVGRFREKKGPQLTIEAFARVHRVYPEARLRMIGEGALLDTCRQLTRELGIAEAVTFLEGQAHSVVEQELSRARCFVQHSVVAASGDSEGTPVAILEAGATGLPVVATRHGGIPDVVVDGQTGFLVDEHDVEGMAERMLCLAKDPALAKRMGEYAREHVAGNFSMDQSLARLWDVIDSGIRGEHIGDDLNHSTGRAVAEAAGVFRTRRATST